MNEKATERDLCETWFFAQNGGVALTHHHGDF